MFFRPTEKKNTNSILGHDVSARTFMRSVVQDDSTVGLLRLFDEPSAPLNPAAEHGGQRALSSPRSVVTHAYIDLFERQGEQDDDILLASLRKLDEAYGLDHVPEVEFHRQAQLH